MDLQGMLKISQALAEETKKPLLPILAGVAAAIEQNNLGFYLESFLDAPAAPAQCQKKEDFSSNAPDLNDEFDFWDACKKEGLDWKVVRFALNEHGEIPTRSLFEELSFARKSTNFALWNSAIAGAFLDYGMKAEDLRMILHRSRRDFAKKHKVYFWEDVLIMHDCRKRNERKQVYEAIQKLGENVVSEELSGVEKKFGLDSVEYLEGCKRLLAM